MQTHPNTITRRSFIGLTSVAISSLLAFGTNAIPSSQAYAVRSNEKLAEAKEAYQKLQELQNALDIASADYYTALEELNAAKGRMDDAQNKIDETTDKIDNLQTDLAVRVRSMYRTGSTSILDLLLGSTSYQAFANNWNLLNSMNENDSRMVEESKTLKAQVEAEKIVFEQQKNIAAEKTQAAEQVKQQASALVNEMQTTYNTLSAEAAELLEQERRAEEEARARAAASASRYSGSMGNFNNNKNQSVPGGTVLERAYAHLGYPYIWGATGPSGFDCSGFVSMCLSGRYGNRLGTTYTFMNWTRVSDPQPGDICTNSYHCGIYVGGGRMVHAPTEGDVVKESAVYSDMIFVRY